MVPVLISIILATGLALFVWSGWGLLANLRELRERYAARRAAERGTEADSASESYEIEDTDI